MMPRVKNPDGTTEALVDRFHKTWNAVFNESKLTTIGQKKYARDIFGATYGRIGDTPERYSEISLMMEHHLTPSDIQDMGMLFWARLKAAHRIKTMMDILERHWDAQDRLMAKREKRDKNASGANKAN